MDLWLSTLASVGQLGLALLVVRKAWRSPLGFPLTLLCLVMFTWNLAAMLYELTGVALFHLLDLAASPFTVPLTVHVVLAFVGRLRESRILLAISYSAFALLAIPPIAQFAAPSVVPATPGPVWTIAFLILMVPAVVFAALLLVAHLRQAGTSEEQARTRLLFAAIAIGAMFGSTELVNNFVGDLPSLGHVGSLGSVALLTAVTLRFRLFGERLRKTHALYALSIALAGFVGILVAVRALSDYVSFMLLAVAVVTAFLVIATRELVASVVTRRARVEELANLGRFSAQMAHDLKNPLAALKGSVQYLEGELGSGASLDDQAEFVVLMDEQIERMGRIVEKYRRLSRIEPALQPHDLSELLRQTVPPAAKDVDVEFQLDESIPPVPLDEDLIAAVFENVAANAARAMPDGGTLTVSASRHWDEAAIEFVDEGEGMDARQQERAFDDFFTTRADGSGMGLAFARRVVQAHDGRITLKSTLGEGTIVRIRLPLAQE
jgi:signal transduction histidine kinase